MFTSRDLKELIRRGEEITLVLSNDYDDCILSNELVSVTHLDDGSVKMRWHVGELELICPLTKAALISGGKIITILGIMPIGANKTLGYDVSIELIYDY